MLYIDKNGGVCVMPTIEFSAWLAGNGGKLPDDIAVAINNDNKYYEQLTKIKTAVKPKIVKGELVDFEEYIPEVDLKQQAVMQAKGNLVKTQADILDKIEHLLPMLMEKLGESNIEVNKICELVEQRDEWRSYIAEVENGGIDNAATIRRM